MLGYKRADFDEEDDDDSLSRRVGRFGPNHLTIDPLQQNELRSEQSLHSPSTEFSEIALFADGPNAMVLRMGDEDEHVLAEPAKTRRAMAAAAAGKSSGITSNIGSGSNVKTGSGSGVSGGSSSSGVGSTSAQFSRPVDLQVNASSSPTGSFVNRPNVVFFGLDHHHHHHHHNLHSSTHPRFAMVKPLFGWSAKCRQLRFLWKKATGLERILVLFALVLIAATIGLFTALARLSNENQHLQHELIKPKYCLTSQCVNVASSMLGAMDTSVSPCDDFYRYSCGGWINSNPLPQGKSIWGAFGKLWQENQLVMKHVLEENITYTSDAQTKAKLYYRSCLDKNDTIEKLGAKPLIDFLELTNGWNITGSPFNAANWSLQDTLEKLHCKYNRGGLFSWAVGTDERNSSRHVLQLDQAALGLPSTAYYNTSAGTSNVLQAYEKYMIRLAQLLHRSQQLYRKQSKYASLLRERQKESGTNTTTATTSSSNVELRLSERLMELSSLFDLEAEASTKPDQLKNYEQLLLDEIESDKEIERQMKLVLQFEIELANISMPLEERRDDERIYHKYTLEQMNKLCPIIDWVQYFKVAFDPINYTITEDEPIIVYSPDYMSAMAKLVQKYNETDGGRIVVANYIAWTAIQSLTSYLSKPFRDASKLLRKALIGSEGQEIAWRYCVTDTNSVMGFALGAMFVDSVFKGDAKPIAQQMIEQIREAFKENLLYLDWMDANTRKLAKEKADAITDMIGFPEYILEADKLDEKYLGLNLTENEYFENNIRVNMFSLQKNIEKILKPANKSEWQMSPPTVNAYYTPTKNQIVFPAGILQTPFYDIHYPKSLNFGAMGVVMGHELTHAFDDQGREYDKFGNLDQWWRNETINNFKDRMQCFVKQYSKYKLNGETLNGKQTLGENIADNGGLKASYRAYEKWMMEHDPELALPGVNLTNRQLFFIGFAQVWCSVSTSESLRLQILNDPHAPAQYRVIGTLSNSKDFAQVFDCPVESPMNPTEKCEVW